MFSAVASGIFAYRNADKTCNGDVGRGAVTVGQTAGLVQEVAKYDGIVAKTARSALSVFSDLAEKNKAFEYAGKVTKFAVNNVNPLICVSGGIKTAMSDDKVKTGITEAAALSAMFAGEGLIKANYDKMVASQTVRNGIKYLSKSKVFKPIFEYLKKHKLEGKAAAVLKGLIFVSGSIMSYDIGHKLGEPVADRVKKNLGIKDKKQESKQKLQKRATANNNLMAINRREIAPKNQSNGLNTFLA